jgi:hypothetical protein
MSTKYTVPTPKSTRGTIGNLDGSPSGFPGEIPRVQSGTGAFINASPSHSTGDTGYTRATLTDLKLRNVGTGSGVFARKEADGVTYSLRKIHGGSNVSVVESNDSITINAAAGAKRFLELSDVPSSFAGEDGKFLVIDTATNSIVFRSVAPGGAENFLALSDTPETFVGQNGKLLRVNETTGKIEFTSLSFDTTFLDLTDTPNSLTGQNDKSVVVDESTGQLVFRSIVGMTGVYIETSPPTSPVVGQTWLNTADGGIYSHYNDGDSTVWVEVTNDETPIILREAPLGATVSNTPPASPAPGDMWMRETDAVLFVRYGNQWVEPS